MEIPDPSAALALEAAIALEEHRRAREALAAEARQNGRRVQPLPLGYLELRDLLAGTARDRQQPPNSPDWSTLLDAVSVPRRVYTIEEAANAASLPQRSFERLLASGEVPSVQLTPGRVGIRVSDLDAWIESRPVTNGHKGAA